MEEKVLLNAVLVFPVWGHDVLLARKKAKIGVGHWNGYGGGIEKGEDIIAACVRECLEESTLKVDPRGLEQIALLDFHNQKSDDTFFTCRVHAFRTFEWWGVPQETVEMGEPQWFRISRLPLLDMMPADREWLPRALSGEKIRGEFWYGPLQKELVCPSIVTVLT